MATPVSQPGEDPRNELVIREWEIFYSYTTHFDARIRDLNEAAEALVRSGLARSALTSDGTCYWGRGGQVSKGTATLATDAAFSRGDISVPRGLVDDGFALETIGQANWYRFSEARLFGEAGLPQPYVRAFLGECLLVDADNHGICLYPMLKLYESGAASVTLRVIGPPHTPLRVSEMVEAYAQLSQRDFTRADVPPGLAELAPLAASPLRTSHVIHRAQLLWKQWLHRWMIQRRTRRTESGDFQFDQTALPSDGESGETTASLALTILNTAAYVTGSDRRGLRFLLLGGRQAPAMCGPWHGRPHIYLVRFSEQQATASQNEERHGAALACVLGALRTRRSQLQLPANQRVDADDYGFYVGPAGSLIVFGREHLESVRHDTGGNLNRGDLIYEEHVKLEVLELGHILTRRFAELVRTRPQDVGSAQRELLDLELTMIETGRYEEVRRLLAAGWSSWGVDRLRDIAERGLNLLRVDATDAAARRSGRVSLMLAAAAVVLAFDPVAKLFVKPAWEAAHLPAVGMSETLYGGVALALLVAVVATLAALGRRPRS